jgi:hypothetical protein
MTSSFEIKERNDCCCATLPIKNFHETPLIFYQKKKHRKKISRKCYAINGFNLLQNLKNHYHEITFFSLEKLKEVILS